MRKGNHTRPGTGKRDRRTCRRYPGWWAGRLIDPPDADAIAIKAGGEFQAVLFPHHACAARKARPHPSMGFIVERHIEAVARLHLAPRVLTGIGAAVLLGRKAHALVDLECHLIPSGRSHRPARSEERRVGKERVSK